MTYDIDWNYAAETSIAAALNQVPTVGSALSALVKIFWPQSGENVWDDIKTQVEDLMQEDIAQTVYELVQDNLSGLQGDMNNYLEVVGSSDTDVISERWNDTNDNFILYLPNFQASGYEVLLLPLFAQFANLHLTLLRDGVLYGSKWGWTSDIVADVKNDQSTYTSKYGSWASDTYTQGYNSVVAKTKTYNHACEPFNSVNAYVRQMTLGVRDFSVLWPFLLKTEPVIVWLTREIYSDPYGTCDDSGDIKLPNAPTDFPTVIKVWSGSMVDGVQLTYPPGSGPGGVTTTARMGDQDGGVLSGTFDVYANPVVIPNARSGDALNSMKFTFEDGTESGWLGNSGDGSGHAVSFNGHYLSSIHINGVSNYYGCADCVVFGFRYAPPSDTRGVYYMVSETGKVTET